MSTNRDIHFKKIGVFLIFSMLCAFSFGTYWYIEHARSSSRQCHDSAGFSVDTDDEPPIEDRIPPHTMLCSAPAASTADGQVLFVWTGSDDTAPVSDLLFSYRLVPILNSWSSWTKNTSVIFSDLEPGVYLFQIRAKDRCGNIEPTPVNYSFSVGASKAEGNSTQGNNQSRFSTYYYSWFVDTKYLPFYGSFFVSKKTPWEKTITISDHNINTLTITLSWQDDCSSRFSRLSRDMLLFEVYASNSSCVFSQVSYGSGRIVFSVHDLIHPPENGVLTAGSTNEALRILSSIKQETWVNDPITLRVSCRVRDLRPLVRLFHEKGNDFVVNISYSLYAPKIVEQDTIPPETTIVQKPKTVSTERTLWFTWQGTDDFTKSSDLVFQHRLEGYTKGWSSWSNEITAIYYDVPVGSYVFTVRCRDAAGNIDPTPAVYAFEIIPQNTVDDSTPPETILLTGPEGVVQTGTVSFSWSGSDDQTSQQDLMYSFLLHNYSASWSSWSRDTHVTFHDVPDGRYLFEVRSRDHAGNIDPTPAQRAFEIRQGSVNRFASKVIAFEPGLFGSSSAVKSLGGPRGKGATAGATDVVTLGLKGSITLGFEVVITDQVGYDFIVFENPFYIGSTGFVFAELVYVEVSSDGVNFARFPGVSRTCQPVPPYMGILPENCTNFAGIRPVYANVDENTIDPFDPTSAGGDAFDLAVLRNHPLVQAGVVDLERICFIRLIDVHGDGTEYDTAGNPIYDPTGGGINGADIDAVAVIHFLKE
ncbi:MAG: triple tyrosine motif-containing protein [Candidatus Thermoplasmatota archaeon]